MDNLIPFVPLACRRQPGTYVLQCLLDSPCTFDETIQIAEALIPVEVSEADPPDEVFQADLDVLVKLADMLVSLLLHQSSTLVIQCMLYCISLGGSIVQSADGSVDDVCNAKPPQSAYHMRDACLLSSAAEPAINTCTEHCCLSQRLVQTVLHKMLNQTAMLC